MDTVGEPDFFQVCFKSVEFFGGAIALIIEVDGFEHPADRQVILEILVEQDIAAANGRFAQIINQLFLLQGQRIEIRNLIPKNFYIVEPIDLPLEAVVSVVSVFWSQEAMPSEQANIAIAMVDFFI